MKKYLYPAGWLLTGLALILNPSGCGRPPGGEVTAATGAAPEFDLENFAGGRARLSDYRGKVVLLNFWATWCPPCRTEIPDFIDLGRKYRERGLVILGVSLDQNPRTALPPFIEKYQINYPILLDNGAVTGAYGGITGIPTTFLIDRQGVIRGQFVGYRPKSVFEEEIKQLL